jgi:hypothetical protein
VASTGLPSVSVDPEHDRGQAAYWFDELQRPTVRNAVEHIHPVLEVDFSDPIIVGTDGLFGDGAGARRRADFDLGRRDSALSILAAAEPKWTELSATRLVPVIVTIVSLALGPAFGESLATVRPECSQPRRSRQARRHRRRTRLPRSCGQQHRKSS